MTRRSVIVKVSPVGGNSNKKESTMIEVGKEAPDFELASHLGGSKFSLSQFKGQKNVMLVFYPLDWTPT
jgi:peroxiredoxin